MNGPLIPFYTFPEPFLESIPQTFILLCCIVKATTRMEEDEIIGSGIGFTFYFFWIKYATAVICSAMGMVRFLMFGPCRLIPNNLYPWEGGLPWLTFRDIHK